MAVGSVFGDIDAEDIQTNPYFVEGGVYYGRISKAEFKENSDGTKINLMISYEITGAADSENEQYVGNWPTDFLRVYPNLTKEDEAAMDADDRKKLKDDRVRLVRRLCGGGKGRPGLGVPKADLNDPDWNPEVLVGTEVEMFIKNWENKEGELQINIVYANALNLPEEA